jgi:hypothetical protein
MTGRRILIVCTWFPPVNQPGARRPYFLARCLRDRGWQVSVLTSAPEEPPAWPCDLNGIRVLPTPRTRAIIGLNAAQRWLLRARYADLPAWCQGPLRVMADLFLPLRPGHRWNLSPAMIDAELGPQDVVLATGPDWTAIEAGARAARFWKAAWTVDYRDPWNVRIPEVAKDIITWQGRGIAGSLRRWRMRRAEKRYSGSALLITAVSRAFLANALAITGASKGVVVHGGFDASRAPMSRARGTHFVLTHTGHLYPEQPWSSFFNALRSLAVEQPQLAQLLRVRFVGTTSTEPRLLRELEITMEATHLIEQLPRVDRDTALRLQEDSDGLLQLALSGKKGYLPVKFLEYLGARRPILLFSKEQDEMEEVLMTTRTGTIARDQHELLNWLVGRLQVHADGGSIPFAPDEEALQAFDYHRSMGRWAELLEALPARHP